SWSAEVTVAAENDTKTVEIPDLRNLPRDVASTIHSPPPPPHTSSHGVSFVVGAGALALLGGGLGVKLWADSTYEASASELMSQARRDSLYDAANTRRYLAEALAVGGLAAGGVAVWLYLRDDQRERRSTTDASLHVVPTATGLALAGWF